MSLIMIPHANFHQSDYSEVIRWRRLAVTGFIIAAIFCLLFISEVFGGH